MTNDELPNDEGMIKPEKGIATPLHILFVIGQFLNVVGDNCHWAVFNFAGVVRLLLKMKGSRQMGTGSERRCV